MSLQVTETKADSAALKATAAVFDVSVERAPVVADGDLVNSAEVQAAVSQLSGIAAQANEVERIANEQANENADAIGDAKMARDAADNALSGQAAIKAAARSGDKAAVASTIQRTLGGARTALTNAAESTEEHERPHTGTAAERTAHEAAIKASETAKKKAKAPKVTAPKQSAHDDKDTKRAALAGVLAHADGEDDESPAKAKPKKRQENYGTDPDKEEGRSIGAKVKRVKRKGEAGVRSTGVSIAGGVGAISAKKVRTAETLENNIASAKTDEEYDYAVNQWGKAARRNVLGETFVEQEIDDALSSLQGSKVARSIANKENWFSNDIGTSQVVAQLRKNGYIVGAGGSIFDSAGNEKWSHAAVQRMDRNGDKQLSASEIKYAMEHRYVAPAPKAAPKAAPKYTPAQQAARDRVDTNDDGVVTHGEINAALRAIGKTLKQMDTNHDGVISNGELVGIANAPRVKAPTAKAKH